MGGRAVAAAVKLGANTGNCVKLRLLWLLLGCEKAAIEAWQQCGSIGAYGVTTAVVVLFFPPTIVVAVRQYSRGQHCYNY